MPIWMSIEKFKIHYRYKNTSLTSNNSFPYKFIIFKYQDIYTISVSKFYKNLSIFICIYCYIIFIYIHYYIMYKIYMYIHLYIIIIHMIRQCIYVYIQNITMYNTVDTTIICTHIHYKSIVQPPIISILIP